MTTERMRYKAAFDARESLPQTSLPEAEVFFIVGAGQEGSRRAAAGRPE